MTTWQPSPHFIAAARSLGTTLADAGSSAVRASTVLGTSFREAVDAATQRERDNLLAWRELQAWTAILPAELAEQAANDVEQRVADGTPPLAAVHAARDRVLAQQERDRALGYLAETLAGVPEDRRDAVRRAFDRLTEDWGPFGALRAINEALRYDG